MSQKPELETNSIDPYLPGFPANNKTTNNSDENNKISDSVQIPLEKKPYNNKKPYGLKEKVRLSKISQHKKQSKE